MTPINRIKLTLEAITKNVTPKLSVSWEKHTNLRTGLFATMRIQIDQLTFRKAIWQSSLIKRHKNAAMALNRIILANPLIDIIKEKTLNCSKKDLHSSIIYYLKKSKNQKTPPPQNTKNLIKCPTPGNITVIKMMQYCFHCNVLDMQVWKIAEYKA